MKKRWLLMMLSGVLAGTLLCSCGSANESKGKKDYDFYIFNTKGENADAMQKTVDAYEKETGKKVKLFSIGAGADIKEPLRAEMNTNHQPTIYGVMDVPSLVEWVEGGYAMPLSEAENKEFKALAESVPESFQLNYDGENYGIPYNIEGYGYIVDKDMVAALFGEDKVDAFISAYKAADYDEFAEMVRKLSAYIKDGTAGDVVLNGQSFSLKTEKSEQAAGLKGVFSFAGADRWTYGEHLSGLALNAGFKDAGAAMAATKEQVEACEPLLEAYAQVLDLQSANTVVPRSGDLISSTISSYDQAVNAFAKGETFLIQQGNWTQTNLEKANPDVADNLTFLPVKFPIKDKDIQVKGLTAEELNQTISVFVPNNYIINKKAPQEEKEAAEEFLVWLNDADKGMKYIIEDMAFIPFNADPAVTDTGYGLGNSLLEYVSENHTTACALKGAPSYVLTDVLGGYEMENYLTKKEWTENAYKDIAEYAVNAWLEGAGLN